MYLGQRIPVWSLDTKENKYSWPWNITLVLWFLIHSKGQMSRFPQASSKTIIMIKNDKMTRKMIPAKQDTEDDFCVTLVLGGTTIGSRCITPTQWSYKKWQVTTSPATGTTSALTKERLWEHPNEGSVPEFTTWCGLWRPRRGSSAKSLRGTRDGLIWEDVLECVCVCVCVPFVILLLWIHNVSHLLPSQLCSIYGLYACSVSSLLCISCLLCISFSALITEKEDQPNSCWIPDPAFDIRAQACSEMSRLLLSF